jgi:hypothetical protein
LAVLKPCNLTNLKNSIKIIFILEMHHHVKNVFIYYFISSLGSAIGDVVMTNYLYELTGKNLWVGISEGI